jgi:hypothetical protein
MTNGRAVAEDRGHPRQPHWQPVHHTRLILEAAPRLRDSIIVAESWQDVEPIL